MNGIMTAEEIMEVDWMSFAEWLLAQQDRSDHVGHLAYDVAHDEEWPAGAQYLEELERYLKSCDAIAGALKALRTAWEEWCRLAPRRR